MFEDRVLVPQHRVTRVQAYQGHYVPDHGYYPAFGFEADTPVVIHNPGEIEEHPPGATAQNDMQEVKFYLCQVCDAVVRENDIPFHHCEVDDGPQG